MRRRGRGVCPGNNESAGKRATQIRRRGNVHLSTALVQAAICASRKKGSYFKERFWRIKARRGHKRAAMAIAHSILLAAYEMLRKSQDFRDLGAAYLDTIAKRSTEKRLVRRLQSLGYKVTLEAA